MPKTLDSSVVIQLGEIGLEGDLEVPDGAKGIIVFVHGSGSSRLSPRNRFVAKELQKVGLATLLFDLLTAEEDQDYDLRFDIALLTKRLISAVNWLGGQEAVEYLPIGLFGASTGAAAAMCAAAELGSKVSAVVSRGGRPDLAAGDLHRVLAPSLFIVGGDDLEVLELNRIAMAQLPESTVKRLDVVPAATHLFEEVGTLEQVAKFACDWFVSYATKQVADWEEC